jgi:hypothetical protein
VARGRREGGVRPTSEQEVGASGADSGRSWKMITLAPHDARTNVDRPSRSRNGRRASCGESNATAADAPSPKNKRADRCRRDRPRTSEHHFSSLALLFFYIDFRLSVPLFIYRFKVLSLYSIHFFSSFH